MLPIHFILFAVFPFLATYVHNIGLIPLREIFRPIGTSLLATFGLWALFLLLTRNALKAALVASAAVLVYFSYPHLMDLLPPSRHSLSLRALVAPVCIAGLGLLIFAILKTRRLLKDATAVMNLASLVLLAPSCFALVANIWKTAHSNRPLPAGSPDLPQPGGVTPVHRRKLIPSATSKNLPDVYYIILDAYGRADRLSQFYGYDNTPFIQALEARGFYVAKRSGANYDQTPLCLASALSMNYLPDAAHGLGPDALREKIDDNAVSGYLSSLGLHYVYIGSGEESSHVVTADLMLNCKPEMTEFESEMFANSLNDASAPALRKRYDGHREDILGAFRELNHVAPLPYPKFVFAHILSPHPPFVFGANGEAVDPRGALNFADASWLLLQITRDEYKSRYIAQLEYINRLTLEAIDSIQRQSARPPIIILQGDHGSRMNLNWDSRAKTDLREPFSILNAYCVPGSVRADLYDTITPVNSFRILLTDVYGAKYAKLPDRNFYSTVRQPYDFEEVTEFITGSRSAAYSGPTEIESSQERKEQENALPFHSGAAP